MIPRGVAYGLVLALHIRLNHPSPCQLKRAFSRSFFALDSDSLIEETSQDCGLCRASRSLPKSLVEQSTSTPPTMMGIRYSRDVFKQQKQLIFVAREDILSFTLAVFVQDEK